MRAMIISHRWGPPGSLRSFESSIPVSFMDLYLNSVGQEATVAIHSLSEEARVAVRRKDLALVKMLVERPPDKTSGSLTRKQSTSHGDRSSDSPGDGSHADSQPKAKPISLWIDNCMLSMLDQMSWNM